MLTITLYTVTKDNNYLDKTTGVTPINNTPLTIDVISRIDNLNPVFVIAKNDTYYAANYVKDSNDRYYYITNKAVDTASRLVLTCAIDVLQTYASDIKNAPATVIRSESIGRPTIYTDDKLPVYANVRKKSSIAMPETSGSLDADGDNCYLLTVVGAVN